MGELKVRELRAAEDVEAFWKSVRSVPRWTGGRTHKQMERYYVALYLMRFAENGLLAYPLRLKEEESQAGQLPDFMITWPSGESTGLEVTRAAETKVQAAITHLEKQCPDGAILMPNLRGYGGDELEGAFCALVRGIVEKKVQEKLPKYNVSQCDLLVHDETSMGAGDRRKTLQILEPWARELKQREPKLGKLSIVASLDVLYDVGGESRVFGYVNWTAPDEAESLAGETFSERVEYAGEVAAARAVQSLKKSGIPVYLTDSKERLVKEMPDGRRFEVRIDNDGREVLVRELSRA